MDYSGDYGQLLDDMDDLISGGYQLLGRNFNNPENDVIRQLNKHLPYSWVFPLVHE